MNACAYYRALAGAFDDNLMEAFAKAIGFAVGKGVVAGNMQIKKLEIEGQSRKNSLVCVVNQLCVFGDRK